MKDQERLAEENLFIYTTYTESPADAIAQYMITNRDKFAPAVQDKIMNRIGELYKMDVLNYLTARVPFDQQKYSVVKKGVMDLGLNKDNYYTTAFRFIESYGAGDMDAFMTLCENEYDQLNDDYKSSLMYSFANVFANANETVKKRAAKFIRHSFLDMDATMIMFVAQQLMQLEGKGH